MNIQGVVGAKDKNETPGTLKTSEFEKKKKIECVAYVVHPIEEKG